MPRSRSPTQLPAYRQLELASPPQLTRSAQEFLRNTARPRRLKPSHPITRRLSLGNFRQQLKLRACRIQLSRTQQPLGRRVQEVHRRHRAVFRPPSRQLSPLATARLFQLPHHHLRQQASHTQHQIPQRLAPPALLQQTAES